jgi:glycolate oxidase FAD binding subunit
MVATIEAGASLAEANAVLARARQWLPIDPPHAGRATIGGIVATNDSGPHRHRYGSPRDLIIGIEMVTGGGRVARAGGQVVKNVAGYDLARTLSGSFGELGAIVSATFKLAPLPETSCTLRVAADSSRSLARLVRLVTGSQREPVACEVAFESTPSMAGHGHELLLRFATVASAIATERAAACELLARKALAVDVVSDDRETNLWTEHATRQVADPALADTTVLRVNWRPAELEAMLDALSTVAGATRVRLTGRARLGAGRVVLAGEPGSHAAIVRHLRQSPLFGHVVVVSGSRTLKDQIDVWPPAGDRQILYTALKKTFDPADILGAGRGPL